MCRPNATMSPCSRLAAASRTRAFSLTICRQHLRIGSDRFEARRSKVSIVRSRRDRKSTRLNSSHSSISYAVFCLKKKTERANEEGKLDSLPSCLEEAKFDDKDLK